MITTHERVRRIFRSGKLVVSVLPFLGSKKQRSIQSVPAGDTSESEYEQLRRLLNSKHSLNT